MRVVSRAVLVGLLVLFVTVTGRAAGVLLQGTIVDPAGRPISGAKVELMAGGKTVAQTVSAADGGFRFADVAAGTYDVNVSLAGFRQTRATVTVGTTGLRPLRLTLLIGSMIPPDALAGMPPEKRAKFEAAMQVADVWVNDALVVSIANRLKLLPKFVLRCTAW